VSNLVNRMVHALVSILANVILVGVGVGAMFPAAIMCVKMVAPVPKTTHAHVLLVGPAPLARSPCVSNLVNRMAPALVSILANVMMVGLGPIAKTLSAILHVKTAAPV